MKADLTANDICHFYQRKQSPPACWKFWIHAIILILRFGLGCYHLSKVTGQCIGVLLQLYPQNIHYTSHLAIGNCSFHLEWIDCGREKRCRNSGWAGMLLLLSFLYRTWQYDNILSTILSDTRLWSSPIINPGWAPVQVVQERRPTDCQYVWQTPSIPQTWRWSCAGDTLTLSLPHSRWTQQSFSQQTHLWNSLLNHC